MQICTNIKLNWTQSYCILISDKSIDIKMQLTGTISLLFLLGTPWIFSAFGALTSTSPYHRNLSFSEGLLKVHLSNDILFNIIST